MGRHLRKGATDAILKFVEQGRRHRPLGFTDAADRISRTGRTPLAADGAKLLGIVHLKGHPVKGGMRSASRSCGPWGFAR